MRTPTKSPTQLIKVKAQKASNAARFFEAAIRFAPLITILIILNDISGLSRKLLSQQGNLLLKITLPPSLNTLCAGMSTCTSLPSSSPGDHTKAYLKNLRIAITFAIIYLITLINDELSNMLSAAQWEKGSVDALVAAIGTIEIILVILSECCVPKCMTVKQNEVVKYKQANNIPTDSKVSESTHAQVTAVLRNEDGEKQVIVWVNRELLAPAESAIGPGIPQQPGSGPQQPGAGGGLGAPLLQ
jgi:hypothetical protein